ncbi:MAG: SDR family oxidoreductase [Rhodoferax sp.]|nr:SDR family oxidoreductase [Rhodoferax sp.]
MNISADLRGKRALVTGSAAGIGLATVEALVSAGASVAMNDLPGSMQLAHEVHRLKALGHQVSAAEGDVGNPDSVVQMVALAADALGGLDYLVNNAATPGTSKSIPSWDLDSQDEAFWTKLLSVNLMGPFRCIRAALPYLRQSRGAIVNVASTAAFGGGGSSTTYATAKAGLVLMTRELAKGLGPDVRVNGVAPGWVAGSNWECGWDLAEANAAAATLPLGRSGVPADYAEVIFFLCAGAGYMTGQTLIVDGGLLA